MADTAQQLHEVLTETERILGWRYDEFDRMGFDAHDCELLRDSEADLHFVSDLLAAGCPTQTALAIAL
jgi:hypothetical protein